MAFIRVDRYSVVQCDGGYDIYDCYHNRRVYEKPIVTEIQDAIDLCEDLIETTGERKSVWITISGNGAQ